MRKTALPCFIYVIEKDILMAGQIKKKTGKNSANDYLTKTKYAKSVDNTGTLMVS